ncbi:hypothetical protein TRFO_03893 [Tritrichomonas foetus]|uniref:Calponin-homology (CH) domain-containing protein n=1 Tax=Tritrichomonas foetus TaxID=1144522 RepID=A0A1J4KPN7_9EUKA|nr:hypothetical protein TRFO_03893 [Tritrichomonas foetus]|eukprot:OHT11670.1 hypothetical protein TRFO_03893 [Tritrichomonas foetus]
MDKGKSLRVVPDSIFFRDLSPGDSDSVEIWIHNVGKKPVQMRLKVPPDSPFHLSTSSLPMTAPGLEAKVTISYKVKESIPVSSELFISSEDCSITVPITAIPPCPRITPDKTKISLGTVGVNSDFKFTFSLSNIGITNGTFNLSSKEKGISFIPENGTILPSKSVEISCNFRPSKVNDYNFQIKIDTPGAFEPCSPIDVSASASQHSLALMIDEKEVNELDFSTIYFGQKRVITATIVNRGPFKQSFVVLPPRDSSNNSPRDNSRNSLIYDNDENEVIFSASPSEGLLNPYGSQTVKFVFNPPVGQHRDEENALDDISFNQFTSIEVVETSQKLEFQLIGKAVHHRVSLSSVDFTFDKTSVKQKSSLTLTIHNLSNYLPTNFEIKPVAHFRFDPIKANIKANQSLNVNIVFYPKNLGLFEIPTVITFCGGLIKKRLNLFGPCGDEDKPFKRVPVYESDQETKFNAMHPDSRFAYDLNEIKKNENKRAKFDSYLTDAEKKRDEIAKKKEKNYRMKREAEAYLLRTVGTFTEDDVKEYMQTHIEEEKEDDLSLANSGLSPPEPQVSRKAVPLRLPNPEKFGLIMTQDDERKALNNRKKEKLDDNVLIKKKFKIKPTTPNETNECNRPLTPAQQLMVVSSHQTINFGQLSVFSHVAKSFTIQNNLQQHVLVSIKYEYDELGESTPPSQVIPPNSVAGFDIKFSSSKPQNFNKTIQYTVNGHHTHSFNICAQVIPMDVQLSRSQIEFKFSSDSTLPVIKEFVSIINKSNSVAEYSWSGQNPPFFITESTGYIEANKTKNVEIVYRPGNKTHDECSLMCKITGGPSSILKCIGDVGTPKCSLIKKTINFGLIPIGIEKMSQLKVKNTGDDDAIFTVLIPKTSPELQISPMNGRVGARECVNLQVVYKAMSAHSFDIPVNISICGAQQLTFTVTGQSELPNVSISNSEFDFGRVFVGSSGSIDTSISNSSEIPAILFLDLTNHPEFRIEFPTNLSNDSSNEKKNSISLVLDQTFITKMETNNGDYISSSRSENTGVSKITPEPSNLKDNDADAEKGLIYKIELLENSTINFSLIFQPTEMNDHSFELPISMMNILSSSSFHLQPIVSAEAIEAPIVMSKTFLDFGILPIRDPENPYSQPKAQTLSLLNSSHSDVTWKFEICDIYGNFIETSDNLNAVKASRSSKSLKNGNNPKNLEGLDCFEVTPKTGTLSPRQSITATVKFSPKNVTPYNCYLSLYAVSEGDRDDNLIGKVQLTGVGSSAMFRPSLSEVCLPIVPIGVKSQVEISILNCGSIQSLLRIQIPVDEATFPVKITFPEGNQLLHTTQKIPLNISFQSNKPMSFTTLVAIMDEIGNASSFVLTCTCDNSLFTIYPYLSNKIKNKTGKDAPFSKEYLEGVELQSRFIMCHDYLDLKGKNWENSFTPSVVQFFQRYLNALVLGTQISHFPNDFINNQGSLMNEAIQNLTGSKKANLSQEKDSISKEQMDPVMKRKEAFKSILHSLQSIGGLLSSIRPEFLMSRSDFMTIMRNKITKQMLGIDYFGAPDVSSFNQIVLGEFTSSKTFSNNMVMRLKVLENLYEKLSMECWMAVLMQVFKLFVIARIDPEKMFHIAGYHDALKQAKSILSKQPNGKELFNEINKPSKTLQSSSIGSAQELSLLKWVKVHNVKVGFPANLLKKKTNDFNCFKDSIALANLIKSHSPMFHSGSLNESATEKHHLESNAIEFVNGVKSLKLSFVPQADEIIDGSQCVLATLTEYFFETLPHYLPSVTLEFNTTLHKNVTKTVSLTNPSKSEIIYRAKIEGSNSFTLPEEAICVGPGQTVDFPIIFAAKSVKSSSARVTFIPNRPRAVSQNPNSSEATSARSPSRMPQYSAPVVVDIISNVSIDAPEETFHLETNVYNPATLTIPVKNVMDMNVRMNVLLKVIKIADENGKAINGTDNITQQMSSFIENPFGECEKDVNPNENDLHSYIKAHNKFILSEHELTFNTSISCVTQRNTSTNNSNNINSNDNSENASNSLSRTQNLDLEFVPIELGTYRVLILFYNKDEGEFIYEVIAKSILPIPTEIGSSKFKTEAGKKCNVALPIELCNGNLLRALSYSFEKRNKVSDRKFKDLMTRKVHELEVAFRQKFQSQKYSIISSAPQYFEMPNELTLTKITPSPENQQNNNNNNKGPTPNTIGITFKPIKAGEYPCKIVLLSATDIRVYQVKGIGIPTTRELSLEFSTAVGKNVKQDVPLINNSDDTLQAKINISGDTGFSAPSRVSVKPKTTGSISISYSPYKIGTFSAEMTVFNCNKESTTIYKMTANVEEPPAEDKIIVECNARQDFRKDFEIKPFIRNGTCTVTTTVPMIKIPNEITFENGIPAKFEFSLYAPRSGVSAGTITFTDPQTKNFIWYIIELHIDSPAPEDTIEINTIARKNNNFSIPLKNDQNFSIKYSVTINDDEMQGAKEFIVPSEYTSNYPISFIPIKVGKRTSAVHFYSDFGEFWYKLQINVDPPQEQILAPVTAPIGKTTSIYVQIENPQNKNSSYRVENDNPTAFNVISKNVINFAPKEKKRIEIRYIPTSVGIKETSKVKFISKENGDYEFTLSGTGKPPQPLSPTIVSATVEKANSALVLFTNPFSYPARFSVSLTTEHNQNSLNQQYNVDEIFKFLLKRKIFTLNSYGEEYQVPFTFTPKEIGQFKAFIIISSLGPARGPLPELESLPSIRWVYPIIGNSTTTSASNETHQLKSRSQQTITQQLNFTLVGETETFKLNEYSIILNIPTSFEFIRSILDLKPEKIEKDENSTLLIVNARFSPQRPFNQNISLTIKNPLGQEWQFPLDLSVELGKPISTIVLESLLNKTGSSKIVIPHSFRQQTPFHAYFAAGSASEFSLSEPHGMIEPNHMGKQEDTELPIEILFSPKMYGKILKGLLVIDTLESQFIFDVVGKTPDYIPPVIKSKSKSKFDVRKEADNKKFESSPPPKPPNKNKKKRNIIKDNIENVRITKPKVDQK